MLASANASALARTLLALARAHATGKLRISGLDRADCQSCELSVFQGHAGSLALLGEPLDACDVLAALAQALGWTSVRTQLDPLETCAEAALAPWAMSELLLLAAERALHEHPFEVFARDHRYIERSAFGGALERAGTQLLPPALALQVTCGELRMSSPLLAALAASELARMRAAFWLGALVPRQASARSYTLLLRKHRQLRAQADPHALLELAPGARAADARRALRRLASRLHPDALGPSAPPALRALSSELMCALVQAEQAVRRDART